MRINTNKEDLAKIFYFFDILTREQLSKKQVTSERDYVSRLVTYFNLPFGEILSLFNLKLNGAIKCNSIVLENKSEQAIGCDSAIVLNINGDFKVCFFEAKFQRITNPKKKNSFDKVPKGNKISHFASQIKRQQNYVANALIWEMFINEKPLNSIYYTYDSLGSTCVLSKHANTINRIRYNTKKWKDTEVVKLIETHQTSDSAIPSNIYGMIYELFNFVPETPYEIQQQEIIIASKEIGRGIKIPKFGDGNMELLNNIGIKQAFYLTITSADDN